MQKAQSDQPPDLTKNIQNKETEMLENQMSLNIPESLNTATSGYNQVLTVTKRYWTKRWIRVPNIISWLPDTWQKKWVRVEDNGIHSYPGQNHET